MVSAGQFHKIYDPSVGEAEPWYINDHCFVRADDGLWHLFGITHPEPANPLDEKFLAHATAPDPMGPWSKQPAVLPAEASWGETHVWAPHVIRHEGEYYMFYCAGGASNREYRIHFGDLSRSVRVAAPRRKSDARRRLRRSRSDGAARL